MDATGGPHLSLVGTAESVAGVVAAIPFPLTYPWFWIAVWACAAVGAAVYAALARPHWTRAAGMALMTVPLWIAAWGFVNSIPALADPGSFIPPRSRYRLSSSYVRSLLIDIGYLGAGFLLWTAKQGWPRRVADIAARLRGAGLTWGPSEAQSAWIGWLWLPGLLAGTWLLDLFVSNQVPQLINGDESRVWENMTVFHAVMISAAAAMTEELVYRVLALLLAAALLRRLGARGQTALWGAVVLQAVLFGLAHGGYGTLYHVIGPTLFGLIAGVAAVRFGIWSAIALHFLIDLYVFGAYAAQNAPWVWYALWTLLAANVAMTLWSGSATVRHWWMDRRSAEGEI